MSPNIECLIEACRELSMSFQVLHPTQNVVAVPGPHLFVNWSTPLVSHSVSRLMQDKDYTWHLLNGCVRMPQTRAYLTPNVEECFRKYLTCTSITQIVSDIESTLAYPLIVKRNAGSFGSHVYRCENSSETRAGLERIYDEKSKEWDYVALAQQYIPPKTEYRAVFLDNVVAFAYIKDIREASYSGNLSPLHWENARALLVEDQAVLQKLNAFMKPVFNRIEAPFFGADIIEDHQGDFWLIELNGSPHFEIFLRDNDRRCIVDLYKRMLMKLAALPVSGYSGLRPILKP